MRQTDVHLWAVGSWFVLHSCTGNLIVTPSLPRSHVFVGGVFTHFAVTRQCARRWGLCENPLPGATKQTGEEMNTSLLFSHLYLLPQHIPTSPLPPSFSLIHPRRRTDNPKGHLWPPPLAPPFCFSSTVRGKKKERKNARGSFNSDHPERVTLGVAQASSSSHRNFFPHHFLVSRELIFFIHEGEKVPRIGKL